MYDVWCHAYSIPMPLQTAHVLAMCVHKRSMQRCVASVVPRAPVPAVCRYTDACAGSTCACYVRSQEVDAALCGISGVARHARYSQDGTGACGRLRSCAQLFAQARRGREYEASTRVMWPHMFVVFVPDGVLGDPMHTVSVASPAGLMRCCASKPADERCPHGGNLDWHISL
jgi:hypothetical protein